MSTSETITRTDLANILNEVLPVAGAWATPARTKSLTGTTDANGNLSLGLSSSDVPSVISVVGSNYVYTPFVYSGNWYAKVVSSNSAHTPIISESVSVAITYLSATDPSTWQYTPLTSSNPSMYTNPAGGYYKLGRLIVVQCRFYVTGTFPSGDYNTVVGGLPVPSLVQASLGVTWNYADSAPHASAVVSSTGLLVVQSGSKALTASTLFITGAYIAQ